MTDRKILVELLERRFLLAADIAVSFSGKIPTAIPAIGKNRITLQLINRGDASVTGPATVQLYASPTTAIDSSALLLGSAPVNTVWKPGKTVKPVISFNSPANLNTGSYYLVAAVIPGFVEDNFDNDVAASKPVKFSKPIVDLTASVVMSPANAKYTVGGKAQKPIKFTLTIRNSGSVAAKGNAAITLAGSSDTTLDQFDPQLQNFGVKRLNLNPGKTAKFTFNWKPTAATQSGTYFGLFQVNGTHSIQETDFTNNVAATSTQLTITNPAKPIIPQLTSALISDTNEVVVGYPDTIHFSASVAHVDSTTSVELDEVDASDNVISKVADLSDSGSRSDADTTAGDGTYGAVLPVSFTAAGTRYFAARVTDAASGASSKSAAFALSAVLPLTTDQMDQDEAFVQSIAGIGQQIATGGGNGAAMVAAMAASLSTNPNVAAGSIDVETDAVSWETTDGTLQCASVDEILGARGAGSDATAAATPAAQDLQALSQRSPLIAPADAAPGTDDRGSAAVYSPQYFQFAPNDEGYTVAKALYDAGLTTTFKYDASTLTNTMTFDDYKSLGGKAAVAIITHGFPTEYGMAIDSGIQYTRGGTVREDLATHRIIEEYGGHSAYSLTPAFFSHYLGSMDGAIVYLGACYSLKDDTLANAFLNAGAASVVGYTKTVDSRFAAPEGIAMFNTLLGSDKNTIKDIPGINVDTDPLVPHALFKALGDPDAALPHLPKLTDVNLVVTYTWPASQKDLDSKTIFAGAAAGFNQAGGTYLKWIGDDQTGGGSETTIVDLYDAWKSGLFSTTISVGVGADWYTPDGGAGPAVINIALEDIKTRKQLQVQTLTIQPGDETEGATSQQGVIQVMLAGSTATDPAVSVKLLAATTPAV